MRRYFPGEKAFETLPTKNKRYGHVWVGVVRRYDQDNEVCDIEWLTYSGARPASYISWAGAGPSSMCGGPPEEGALVVADWHPHMATGNFIPVIVGYLPASHALAKEFALSREILDDVATGPTPNIQAERRRGKRLQRPKLYSGDQALVSSAGSQVLADENLLLSSGGLVESFYRSADLAILETALQHYLEAAGSRLRWGLVERSGLPPSVSDPMSEDDQVYHYVTQGGNASRLEDSNAVHAWVEHRLQLRETSQGQIPIPEGRYPGVTVDRDWLLESVMGTLVGENPQDPSKYRKPLVRTVLSGTTISRAYTPTASETQELMAASAVHLSLKPGSALSPVASLDLDKSGRLAISLGATAAGHPAGQGKSLQIAADGALEAVFSAPGGQNAVSLVAGTGNVLVQATSGDTTVQSSGNTTVNGALVFLGSGSVAGSGRPL